jgi:hypothetical protein
MSPSHRSARRDPRIRIGLLSSLLACALLCFATAALAAKGHGKKHAKHAQPGSYSGKTSESGEIAFTVSSNGKKILSFSTSLGYDGKCGQGGGPGYEVKVASMAITAKGSFSASVMGTFPVASAKVKPIKVKVSGHISGGSASGMVFKPGALCSKSNHANPYSESFTATRK